MYKKVMIIFMAHTKLNNIVQKFSVSTGVAVAAYVTLSHLRSKESRGLHI